jgi:hypothetical protein
LVEEISNEGNVVGVAQQRAVVGFGQREYLAQFIGCFAENGKFDLKESEN